MTLKKQQLDEYYWIVQQCLVKLFDRTPLDAQEMVATIRAITMPTADEIFYHEMSPWQIAGSWVEGKEALTPEEQVTYDQILEEIYGEV